MGRGGLAAALGFPLFAIRSAWIGRALGDEGGCDAISEDGEVGLVYGFRWWVGHCLVKKVEGDRRRGGKGGM